MEINHVQVWNECLSIIKSDISEKSFNTWFIPIKPVKLENKVLTIQVPSKMSYEWLEDKYIRQLKKAILGVLGSKGRLEYKLPVKNERNQSNKKVDRTINPFAIPGLKKIRIDSNLNANYLFSNYIQGDCNKMARSAALAVAKKPGGTSFNPMIIYGGVGLGKTHLAHAIGNEIKTRFPNHNIIYITPEDFTNQIVKAIKDNNIEDFIRFHRNVDTIIIDDIQFLSGRKKSLEILFNIFNEFHQNGKQIILTSDRQPKDLEGMEERLISRFKWGLITDLTPPEFETRMAIIDEKLSNEELEFPYAVKEYICYNITNNIRELEGVCTSIIAQATLSERDVNIELAKEVIQKFVSFNNKKISIENIKNVVASHYKLDVELLNSTSRKREIVMARQISMYLAREYTKHSYGRIGAYFGGKDHSTVMYSIKSVKNMLDVDKQFSEVVNNLEKEVQFTLKG